MAQRGTPGFGAAWDSCSPPLSPWIRDVVRDMGFERMTPVQSGTIPRALKNQDCVVEAVTGSGKTLAFVVPILERIATRQEAFKKGQVAAVVIAPTRELAQQIHQVFTRFISTLHPDAEPNSPSAQEQQGEAGSQSPPPRPALSLPLLVTSGTQNPYETFLSQSSNIIIGTPGRLASFLLSPRGISAVKVHDFDALILDEADRLLSAPDHRKDVERIMRHLPKQRRTHLFSATMTDAVEEIVGLGLRNPVRIVVNLKDKRTGQEAVERRTPTGLSNTHLVCRHAEKTVQLLRILNRESKLNQLAKFIVYFSTCAAVDYFYRILSKLSQLSDFHLTSFHGDLPPRVREIALSTFTSYPASHLSPAVLLCTDVAARGVDFEDVDVVIQFDAPMDPKTFSHRAGRTARAGRKGKAVVLLGRGREEDYVDFLDVRKIPLVSYGYLDAQLQPSQGPESLDPASTDLLAEMRAIVKTDRQLADKGAKAFVSALRAYTKHEASYIFRVQDLDFASVAMAYGLLRLPAMPEIKDWRKRVASTLARREKALAEGKQAEDVNVLTWTDEDVNWDTFAYASKQRESQRQAALADQVSKREEQRLKGAEAQRKRKIRAEMQSAWSEQKERKARKEVRRDQKDKRKAADWAASGGRGEDIGPVEAFRMAKRGGDDGREEGGEGGGGGGGGAENGRESREEFDREYKMLKNEVKAERLAKKSRKDTSAPTGMFDGLD